MLHININFSFLNNYINSEVVPDGIKLSVSSYYGKYKVCSKSTWVNVIIANLNMISF